MGIIADSNSIPERAEMFGSSCATTHLPQIGQLLQVVQVFDGFPVGPAIAIPLVDGGVDAVSIGKSLVVHDVDSRYLIWGNTASLGSDMARRI